MTNHTALREPFDDLLDAWSDDARLGHLERLPSRPARHAEPCDPVSADLLARFGVERLWAHQATAIDLVRAGRSVAVATGTASGKSLCYQLPIAEAALAGERATAIAVFPTKALAHDQLRTLSDLGISGLVPAAYDGDTTPEARAWARARATVVLTNPEMLHHGILPHHARWATFLKRLRYVVIDELHVMRGVFGSHVAHILRRLRRLAAHYGADPSFVFTSATIGRPEALASALCGMPVVPVTDDGSPRGERLFALWNPHHTTTAVHDGADVRHDPRSPSTNRDTAELVAACLRDGHRTIAFCRSRKSTELVARDVGRRLPSRLRHRVRPYRAGYLPTERRSIEEDLASGDVLGVVATTALELGIDIGGLDACILAGFPGTVASMWQQAGRAGRRGGRSVAVLVAGDDQLDQWFMAHPHDLFSREPESAVINPSNPFVVGPHLACAAFELPLTPDDERWWPGLLDDGVRDLVRQDVLAVRRPRRHRPATAVWNGRGRPADRVGLRAAGVDEVRIERIDGTQVGTVDHGRAPAMVHPGALYLHRGQAFRVRDLDLDAHLAVVDDDDDSEYTQPRTDTTFEVVRMDEHRELASFGAGIASVRVRSQVVGYRRYDAATRRLLGSEELDLPATVLTTRGLLLTIPDSTLRAAGVVDADREGALHAAEHAIIGMLPLFTICDRWDVGGVSTAFHPDTGTPTIVVHDAHPGGAGIAELGYERLDELLIATLALLRGCSCHDGCPSCVQSPKCGNGNEPLSKHGAIALLDALVHR